MDVEHLLFALLGQKEGVVLSLLQKLGTPVSSLTERLQTALDRVPQVTGSTSQAFITPRLKKTIEAAEALKDEYVSAEHLRDAFKPEFLNRIDEIIIFNSLGREEIKSIVEIQLQRLRQNLASRKMALEITDRAKALLADKGYDPVYGARPLKRTIQRLIQDPLAVKILEGEFTEGDRIKIDSVGDEMVFRHDGSVMNNESWEERTLH